MTPEQKKKRVYSPSQLILYDSCPGAWADHYLHKEEPTDESYPLAIGSLYHVIRAHYNDACWKKGVRADPAVMEDIAKFHFWENERSALIPDTDWQEMLSLCMRSARDDLFDLDTLVGIEEYWWMSVNDYRFRGKPDIVFVRGNRATVPDYKTSRVVMTDKQVEDDFKSQCYAALVMDQENCPQVEMVDIIMDFPRYRQTAKATFYREHAERVKEEIYQRIKRLEADMKYECTPCDWCPLCRRRSVCPALTHAIAGAGNMVRVIARQDQMDFLVGEATLLRVALNNRLEKMAEYAANVGPGHSSNMTFGPREHRRLEFDAADLYQAYDGTESGPLAMLSPDGRAIRAELKRKKPHEPDVDLKALGREVVSTRMELYRTPREDRDEQDKHSSASK